MDEVAVRLRQYEESLSSSLVSAVNKLSQKVQRLEQSMSYSPPVWASISDIRGKCSSAQEKEYRGYRPGDTLSFTCVTTERT